MDETALMDLLKSQVTKAGSQQALATQLRISPQYLHDVLKGRRKVGERLVTAMGMERRIEYFRRKQ